MTLWNSFWITAIAVLFSKAYENSFINPDGKEKDVFAVNVLKTLFMIKYFNDICNANIDNITSLDDLQY